MFLLNALALRTMQSALGATSHLGMPAGKRPISTDKPLAAHTAAPRRSIFRIEWLCTKK